jgi:hypothetical protein
MKINYIYTVQQDIDRLFCAFTMHGSFSACSFFEEQKDKSCSYLKNVLR